MAMRDAIVAPGLQLRSLALRLCVLEIRTAGL
jgi:hypothetical protein